MLQTLEHWQVAQGKPSRVCKRRRDIGLEETWSVVRGGCASEPRFLPYGMRGASVFNGRNFVGQITMTDRRFQHVSQQAADAALQHAATAVASYVRPLCDSLALSSIRQT